MLRNLKLIAVVMLTFLSTSSFVTFEDNQPNTDLSPNYQSGMEIYIKDLNGKVTTLNVNQDHTILMVKQKMQDATGMPPEVQDLIFAGKSLENDKTLEDYNIQKESTIHLVPRMRRPE